MKHRIIFNQYTSTLWCVNREYNLMNLKSKIKYFEEIIKYRGYIYLNQIYEMLGLEWNPMCDNPCYTNLASARINFEVKDTDDDFEIIITW